MQDGARGIFNAAENQLQPKQIGSCWFHVKQAVFKKKHLFVDKNNYRLFCNDLDTLHASQSPDEYHHGASLFIEKWKRKEEKVCAWFDAEYFGWRQTFFASRTPAGLPATNDPHKNFNKLLKEDGTARE